MVCDLETVKLTVYCRKLVCKMMNFRHSKNFISYVVWFAMKSGMFNNPNAYDCVCVENLDMKAMAQALSFGKSVTDNGWGMFTMFLQYKLADLGKRLVRVDKFFASSQTCNVCG